MFFCFSSFWKLLFKQSSAEAKTTWNLASLISLSYSLVLGFLKTQPTKCPALAFLCLVFHCALQRLSKAKQQELNRWFGLKNHRFLQNKCHKGDDKNIFNGKKSIHSDLLFGFQWYYWYSFYRDEICPAARRGPAAKRKPLTAISGTDQSQLCVVAWRTRLILNNRLSAVPIFLASLVFPCPGFRAPVFAMSLRGSTNSRGKVGTARSLFRFALKRTFWPEFLTERYKRSILLFDTYANCVFIYNCVSWPTIKVFPPLLVGKPCRNWHLFSLIENGNTTS